MSTSVNKLYPLQIPNLTTCVKISIVALLWYDYNTNYHIPPKISTPRNMCLWLDLC